MNSWNQFVFFAVMMFAALVVVIIAKLSRDDE